ncbi:protein-tyrosine-phosphatase [Lacrimispora amygdalina]|uniref:Protein-tyrosine-phosphatase n=1 Tax=Lacrimispora amygdalina TaxID=253257 RepID=A0A3E2N3R6_9FIRM|nr:tyrosine-protein phosphatase [Clostridium indicum]RFZ75614.1 protein-tyrosine-phosphatase [Clostridium indicum]
MNNIHNRNQILFTDNIANFRDLGGCPVQGGKQVKPGHFYRSSVLSKLQQEELDLLSDLNIQMIVDFRSPSEVRSEPDVVPPRCQYYNFSAIDFGTESDSAEVNSDMKSIMMAVIEKKIQLDNTESLTAQYEAMAADSSAFRQMFQLIKANPKAPLLFHCAAGKDRTGVAAALILLCLGSTEETIIEDYLLSNMYRAAENERIIKELSEATQDKALLNAFLVLLGVDAAYLHAFFSKVQELYGNWDSYFEQAISLSPVERAQMKERYLI